MLSLAKARQGFKFHCEIANRSKRTIGFYEEKLSTFEKYLVDKSPDKDPEHLSVADITREQIAVFIADLQRRDTLYEHHAFRAPVEQKLSPYTVLGFSRALSSFFRWALKEEYIASNPMSQIPRPKVPRSIKDRFSQTDIEKLLLVCKETKNEALAARNRVIILFLLDTAVRASELCRLTLDRLDDQFRRAHIIGKGMKDRYVPLGAKTRESLWEYVHVYRPAPQRGNAVFLTAYGRVLDMNKLEHILHTIGMSAGVMPCNPHRFRHTAARMYLRNGGDVLTLQQLLGHETLDVTAIYARMEQEDLERTHARASPVDRLDL